MSLSCTEPCKPSNSQPVTTGSTCLVSSHILFRRRFWSG